MSDDAAEHRDCVRLCTDEKDLYQKNGRPIKLCTFYVWKSFEQNIPNNIETTFFLAFIIS